MLAQQKPELQSTVETMFRVNADDETRAEIYAREEELRVARTMENEIKRRAEQITAQQSTIAEQESTIAEQKSTILSRKNSLPPKTLTSPNWKPNCSRWAINSQNKLFSTPLCLSTGEFLLENLILKQDINKAVDDCIEAH